MGRDTEKKLRQTSPPGGGGEGGGVVLITFKILSAGREDILFFFVGGKTTSLFRIFIWLLQNKIKLSLEQESLSQHVKIKDFLNPNRTFGCLNYEFSTTQSVSGLCEVNLDSFMASGLITHVARAALMSHFLLPPRKSIIFPFNFYAARKQYQNLIMRYYGKQMCRHVSLCYAGSGREGWITATFSDFDCGLRVFYIWNSKAASRRLPRSGRVFAVSFSLLTLKLLPSPAGRSAQLLGRVSPPLSA